MAKLKFRLEKNQVFTCPAGVYEDGDIVEFNNEEHFSGALEVGVAMLVKEEPIPEPEPAPVLEKESK